MVTESTVIRNLANAPHATRVTKSVRVRKRHQSRGEFQDVKLKNLIYQPHCQKQAPFQSMPVHLSDIPHKSGSATFMQTFCFQSAEEKRAKIKQQELAYFSILRAQPILHLKQGEIQPMQVQSAEQLKTTGHPSNTWEEKNASLTKEERHFVEKHRVLQSAFGSGCGTEPELAFAVTGDSKPSQQESMIQCQWSESYKEVMNYTLKHLQVSTKEKVQLCTAFTTFHSCAVISRTAHTQSHQLPLPSIHMVLTILPGTVSGLSSELPIHVLVG